MPRGTGGAVPLPAFALPVAVGDANAAGAAATIVRSDHVHQRSRTDSATIVVAASNSLTPTLADLAYRCDGVADEVEINNAIAAVIAVGGGSVVLLDGTFNLAAPINIRSYVMIIGQGKATILFPTANMTACIYCNVQIYQYTILDLQINGNRAAVTVFGIYITPPGAGTRFAHGIIANCHIHSADYGIYTINHAYSLIFSNTLGGFSVAGVGLVNNLDGIVCDVQTQDTLILNNHCMSNSRHGIHLLGTAYHCIIIGNHCSHNLGHGIYIDGSNNVIISSNAVSQNTGAGIYVVGSECTVVSNICNLNDENRTASYDGIYIVGNYNVVVGNRCFENDRYELNIGGGTRNKVFHNELYGTDHVRPFNDAGTNTELPTVQAQFQQGGTEAGGIQIAQFIHATASAKGWEINADTEWAIALPLLPSELIQVVRIRIWAVGLAAPGAGNKMRLEIAINAGGSDEPYTTEPISVVNKPSNETNFAINDVVTWTITSVDDADIGHLDALDDLEVKVLHEAAGNGDIATDAVFRCVEIQYV